MNDSKNIANEHPELWVGHSLNPHTWPDVQEAIRLANLMLGDALDRQDLGTIKVVSSWLQNISNVLESRVKEIEAEIAEVNNGRMGYRRR